MAGAVTAPVSALALLLGARAAAAALPLAAAARPFAALLASALALFAPMTPGGNAFDLRLFLVGIGLGVLIACFSITVKRYVFSRFCHALLEREAFSEESALSLEELSLPYLPGLKRALANKTTLLSRIVSVAGEAPPPVAEPDSRAGLIVPPDDASGEKRRDPATLRYYFTEQGRIAASVRFPRRAEWRMLLGAILVIALFGYAMYEYLPTVWGVVRSIFGG